MTLFITNSFDGHRTSYFRSIADFFEGDVSMVQFSYQRLNKIVRSESVFFVSIDDLRMAFILVAFVRAIMGLKTAGVLINPKNFTAIEISFSTKGVVRLIFYWMWRLLIATNSKVRIWSIVPFELSSVAKRVAHDCIIDPQFWDLSTESVDSVLDVSIEDYLLERGRKKSKGTFQSVVAYIGRVSESKGFSAFKELVIRSDERLIGLIVGKMEAHDVNVDFGDSRFHIYRGEACEQALLKGYKYADFIWCGYASDYDQMSGIYGRAVQLSKSVIVRRGSLIDLFSETMFEGAVNCRLLESDLDGTYRIWDFTGGEHSSLINAWRKDAAKKISAWCQE